MDYYGAISKQPYIGPWQFTARDDLLLRKSDGLLLVYDEDAGEGSPRFVKEKAIKKQQNEHYPIITVTSEDIQSVAEEERMNDFAYEGTSPSNFRCCTANCCAVFFYLTGLRFIGLGLDWPCYRTAFRDRRDVIHQSKTMFIGVYGVL